MKSAEHILIQYSMNTRQFLEINLMITEAVKWGSQGCTESPVTMTLKLFLVSTEKTDCPKYAGLKSLLSSHIIHSEHT